MNRRFRQDVHLGLEREKQTAPAARLWNRIPAAAAFLLLACQMAVPWTVSHFITQDGPSHLYGATVARELIFHHAHNVYSSVYTIQRAVLPNWTATILLGIAGAIAGSDHAEQLFVSFTILLGFLGLCYVNRALAPDRSPYTPLMNFLLQTWFLWSGFYNFYLGMVLLPYVIGFHIRSVGRLTLTRAAITAVGLVALFFTHLIAVGIALTAIFLITFWTSMWKPWRRGLRETGILLLASIPALILLFLYVHGSTGAVENSTPQIAAALKHFPQHIFLTAAGKMGRQAFLWPLVLCYIVAGVLLMTKKEWMSARGGLVIAALVTFAAYLLVPDKGFGGSLVTIRFAWGVFLLGGVVAPSVSRLRILRVPIALYIAIFLAANVIGSVSLARSLSNAVDDYMATAGQIPRNSSIVRLNYPAPGPPAKYGYEGLARFPFFHLDALAATRKHALDLTDYEPLTGLFPVVYKQYAQGQRYQLWGFEGPGPGAVALLKWVRETFPRPVDFVLLFGDEHSPDAVKAEMPAMRAYLDSSMRLVAVSPDRLLRLYHR